MEELANNSARSSSFKLSEKLRLDSMKRSRSISVCVEDQNHCKQNTIAGIRYFSGPKSHILNKEAHSSFTLKSESKVQNLLNKKNQTEENLQKYEV